MFPYILFPCILVCAILGTIIVEESKTIHIFENHPYYFFFDKGMREHHSTLPIAMCFLMNRLHKWNIIFMWPFNSSPLEQNVTISITPLMQHVNLEKFGMLHYMWPNINPWIGF